MGGIIGTVVPLSTNDIQLRYQLKNKAQARALKRYTDKLGISMNYVDKVYGAMVTFKMDVSGELINKLDFLNMVDLHPTPFAIGAMNCFNADEKCEFFEFFATVHNYCTFDKEKLVAHTFALADADGTGLLTLSELATLVHYVYGERVAKAEVGFIVTTNKTDIETAKVVMKNLDPTGSGSVNLGQFGHGIIKHANLLTPAFTTQQHLRRSVGGTGMWKGEQKRLKRHCEKEGLSLPLVFRDVMKALKKDEAGDGGGSSVDEKGVGRGGQGGFKAMGTHDLAGYERGKKSGERGGSEFGKKKDSRWNAALGASSGAHAFKHKPKQLENQWVTSFRPDDEDALLAKDAEAQRKKKKKTRAGGAGEDDDDDDDDEEEEAPKAAGWKRDKGRGGGGGKEALKPATASSGATGMLAARKFAEQKQAEKAKAARAEAAKSKWAKTRQASTGVGAFQGGKDNGGNKKSRARIQPDKCKAVIRMYDD